MADTPQGPRLTSGATAFDLGAWLGRLTGTPPIVQAGVSVLRHRAESVPSSLLATPALRELVGLMTDVMRAAPGVGLAAPQIGVPLRVFVAEDQEERIAGGLAPDLLRDHQRGREQRGEPRSPVGSVALGHGRRA